MHILCPNRVALRGNVTVFSGEAEFGPPAPLVVRPGNMIEDICISNKKQMAIKYDSLSLSLSLSLDDM